MSVRLSTAGRAPAPGSCRPACRESRPPRVRCDGHRDRVGDRVRRSPIDRPWPARSRAPSPVAVGAVQHDVGGLQVAMNDALLVRGVERVGNLPRDRRAPHRSAAGLRSRRSARVAPSTSSSTSAVRPSQILQPVDRADVRMVQGREQGRASRAKRARRSGSAVKSGGSSLIANVATQLAVASAIDLAHPTRAKCAEDSIRPELSGQPWRDADGGGIETWGILWRAAPASGPTRRSDSTSRRTSMSAQASARKAGRSPAPAQGQRGRGSNLVPLVGCHRAFRAAAGPRTWVINAVRLSRMAASGDTFSICRPVSDMTLHVAENAVILRLSPVARRFRPRRMRIRQLPPGSHLPVGRARSDFTCNSSQEH